MILAIRSDKPQAELYLIDDAGEVVNKYEWQADRALADTLLAKINQFLNTSQTRKSDLAGLAIFTGQGSFTGLRIGTTVANALAYALGIPVVKASGRDWLDEIPAQINRAKSGQYVTPDYDGEPNITKTR